MTQSQFQAAINAAWLEPVPIAIDLLALTRTLLLDGDHALAEDLGYDAADLADW